MLVKELAEQYKKDKRPIKLGKNRVEGGKVYAGKLAQSECRNNKFASLAKRAGK